MRIHQIHLIRLAAIYSLVVVMATAMLVVLATPVIAQTASAAAADAEEAMEEVVVIGSRRRDRSVTDSPVPVDIIGGDELASQGSSEMEELIASLVPSLNINREPISDATTFMRPASLRGLAPDATLVLLNGKRRHRGAIISLLGAGVSRGAQGVDVAAIPTIALGRLEVLRDGASSQYGSDAIAGVINFVLKEDTSGMAFDVKWGQFFEGDGTGITLSGNFGLPLMDNGFANLSFELKESDRTNRAIQGSASRALINAGNTMVPSPAQPHGSPEFSNDYKLLGNFGIDFGNGLEGYAFANYAARQVETDFFWRNPIDRSGVTRGPKVDPSTGNQIFAFGPQLDMEGKVMKDDDDNVIFKSGMSNRLTLSQSIINNVNGATPTHKLINHDLTDYLGMTPVSSVKVADLHKDAMGANHWSSSNPTANCQQVPILNNKPDPGILAVVNADPDCYTLYQKFPGGFVPQFGGRVKDYALAAGVRGDMGDWFMDISAVIGSSDAEMYIYDTVNPQLLSQGNDIPTHYEVGGYTETDYTLNLDLSRAVDMGFHDPLNVAFGFEIRQEEFRITQGDDNSHYVDTGINGLASQGFGIGSNGFAGIQPDDAGIHSVDAKAAYLDLETMLSEDFLVQLAMRIEDYDDFGSTTNGKLAMRYQFYETLALRGAYSTGFRAPTAGQANLRNVSTLFDNGEFVEVGTVPATRFNNVLLEYRSGSNHRTVQPSTLKPEESTNLTLGAVFEIGPADVTLDYYKIKTEDRITFTQRFALTNSKDGTAGIDNVTGKPCAGGKCTAQRLIEAGFTDADELSSVQFYSNEQTLKVTGVDLVVTLPFVLGAGESTVTAAANYSRVKLQKFNRAYTSASRQREIEHGNPDNRYVLTWSHLQGPWRFMARARHYGKFYESLVSGNQFWPNAKTLVDIEFGYDVTSEFTLTLGGQNVNDAYPSESPNGGGSSGLIYPSDSPFGFNGGYYYLRANWNRE